MLVVWTTSPPSCRRASSCVPRALAKPGNAGSVPAGCLKKGKSGKRFGMNRNRRYRARLFPRFCTQSTSPKGFGAGSTGAEATFFRRAFLGVSVGRYLWRFLSDVFRGFSWTKASNGFVSCSHIPRPPISYSPVQEAHMAPLQYFAQSALRRGRDSRTACAIRRPPRHSRSAPARQTR